MGCTKYDVTDQEYPFDLVLDADNNVYVTGSQESAGNADFVTIKYSQTGPLLTLNLTAFIQGFYNSVSNNMISDTARVYLRNASSPYNNIDSSKGILNSSGTGTFLFSNAVSGVNYYIAVKHRNSIETWSSFAIPFLAGTLTFNFATFATQAYGSNEIQVDASPVRFAFYGGDVNQDGSVDLADGSLVDNDAGNFTGGYVKTDINGDFFVDVSDVSIVENNAYNFVGIVRP
ncbi:MAG: hypothetical protein M3R36_13900 [Bacteroidota bacterium]|nr:hypothetical protein [Bacteroidota bacterium]